MSFRTALLPIAMCVIMLAPPAIAGRDGKGSRRRNYFRKKEFHEQSSFRNNGEEGSPPQPQVRRRLRSDELQMVRQNKQFGGLVARLKILREAGQFATVIATVEAIDPLLRNVGILMEAAQCHESLGHTAEAIQYYRQITAESSDPPPFVRLADLLRIQADRFQHVSDEPQKNAALDEGIAVIQRALASHPDDSRLSSQLSVLQRKRGNEAEADASLERACALDPEHVRKDVSFLVSQLLDRKHLDEVRALLERFRENFGHTGWFLRLLGQFHDAKGEIVLGHRSFARALQQDPTDIHAALGLTRHAKIVRGRHRRLRPLIEALYVDDMTNRAEVSIGLRLARFLTYEAHAQARVGDVAAAEQLLQRAQTICDRCLTAEPGYYGIPAFSVSLHQDRFALTGDSNFIEQALTTSATLRDTVHEARYRRRMAEVLAAQGELSKATKALRFGLKAASNGVTLARSIVIAALGRRVIAVQTSPNRARDYLEWAERASTVSLEHFPGAIPLQATRVTVLRHLFNEHSDPADLHQAFDLAKRVTATPQARGADHVALAKIHVMRFKERFDQQGLVHAEKILRRFPEAAGTPSKTARRAAELRQRIALLSQSGNGRPKKN